MTTSTNKEKDCVACELEAAGRTAISSHTHTNKEIVGVKLEAILDSLPHTNMNSGWGKEFDQLFVSEIPHLKIFHYLMQRGEIAAIKQFINKVRGRSGRRGEEKDIGGAR